MIHDFKAIKRLAKIINILYLPTALPCKIAGKKERDKTGIQLELKISVLTL